MFVILPRNVLHQGLAFLDSKGNAFGQCLKHTLAKMSVTMSRMFLSRHGNPLAKEECTQVQITISFAHRKTRAHAH